MESVYSPVSAAQQMNGWIKIQFLTPAHEILDDKGAHTGEYAKREVTGYGWQEIKAGACIAVYDDKGKPIAEADMPTESSTVTGELLAKKPF